MSRELSNYIRVVQEIIERHYLPGIKREIERGNLPTQKEIELLENDITVLQGLSLEIAKLRNWLEKAAA